MEVVDLTGSDPVVACRIELAGKPAAMPRPRVHWRRRFFYNPASKKVAAFRAVVKAAIPATQNGVLFGAGVPLTVAVTFHMRRPNTDFKSGNRIGGALKAMAPLVRTVSPDTDNLVKFVLDGLNGVMFADDRQVVKLVALKLMDSQGECEGRTVIEVSEFDPMSLL
jgi:Holliday junction resolvase RusA-like endonuclease